MNRNVLRTISVAGAVVAIAGAATAQITPIFTNITGAPGNTVPSLSNGWRPGIGTQFDRAYVSPDGQRWVLGGFANEATTSDRIVVIGSGPSRSGAQLILQEQVTPIDGVLFAEFVDKELSINNAGQVALAINTLGATTIDEAIVKYDPAAVAPGLSLIAQEGTNYATLFPGESLGGTLDSPSITADGTVAFKGLFTSGTVEFPSAGQNNDFLFLGSGFVAREGVTVPTGGTSPWDGFDAGTYFVADDGVKYIAIGDDESTGTPSTDGIMVYNGNIVAREGDPLPSGVFPDVIASEVVLSRNGDHWIIRNSGSGTGVTQDFVIVNGSIVARTDDPITPGASEFYDDALFTACFFSVTINNNGDYVIGGVTTALDINANAVLVLNGEQVVVREGDPVDLNENGDPNDDNAFVSVFNDDDAFLTDDLGYYFMANLRDGAGASLGQAFLFIQLGAGNPCPPCAADYDQNGGVDGGDLAAFFTDFETGATCADVDQNGGVDGGDLGFFFTAFEQGGCE